MAGHAAERTRARIVDDAAQHGLVGGLGRRDFVDGRERRRADPAEARVLHAERIEDPFLGECVERLSGESLDDPPQVFESHVGIHELLPGLRESFSWYLRAKISSGVPW